MIKRAEDTELALMGSVFVPKVVLALIVCALK